MEGNKSTKPDFYIIIYNFPKYERNININKSDTNNRNNPFLLFFFL